MAGGGEGLDSGWRMGCINAAAATAAYGRAASRRSLRRAATVPGEVTVVAALRDSLSSNVAPCSNRRCCTRSVSTPG